MRFPHFDFYPGDWQSDIGNASLSYEEQGVHMKLLCLMWDTDDCTLPDNDQVIARLLGVSLRKWKQWRRDLIDGDLPVFELSPDGRIYSKKLRKIFQRACLDAEKKRNAAAHRWQAEKSPEPALNQDSGHADALQVESSRNAPPLPSHVTRISTADASHQSSVKGSINNNNNAHAREAVEQRLQAAYFEGLGVLPNPLQREALYAYLSDPEHPLDLDVVCDACRVTGLHAERRTWSYLDSVLRNRRDQGLVTMALVNQAEASRTRASPGVESSTRVVDRSPPIRETSGQDVDPETYAILLAAEERRRAAQGG